jgi:uncharacterized protein (TIGR02246 family)
MKRIAATLLVILFATSAVAEEKEKSPIQIKTEAVYEQWMKAIESKDPKAIAALYAEKAQVMTSSSQGLLQTPEELTAFYEKLAKVPDFKVTKKRTVFDLYEGKTPILSGVVNFAYAGKDRVMRMPARFSMVFEDKDGKLLISKQHFSSMPL